MRARKATKQKGSALAGLTSARSDPKASRLAEAQAAYKKVLQQQAATADILRAIARSHSDPKPVFDAIAKSAVRLLGGFSGAVTRRIGDALHLAAYTSVSKTSNQAFEQAFPVSLSSGMVVARAARAGAPVSVADTETDPHYAGAARRMARARGFRSSVAVPMIRDKQVVGTISVTRELAGEFPKDQIELLKTFAKQAVVAVENARLFNETKEALERQKASADILHVIASSPTDVQPVLDAMAETAARLCGANDVVIRRVDGDQLRLAAHFGPHPITVQTHAVKRTTVAGRAALERRPIQVDDLQSPQARKRYPQAPALRTDIDYRTILAVPLIRNDQSIGVILMRRLEVRPFAGQQIALLQSFADQAVIAIENVRLFNETKEALEHQRASAEVLRIVSRSMADVQPVFDTILASVLRLFEGFDATVWMAQGSDLVSVARDGPTVGRTPGDRYPLSSDAPGAIVIRNRKPLRLPDVAAATEIPESAKRAMLKNNRRAVLWVPLLRDGKAIGTLSISRAEPFPLSEKHQALLESFADQAVIAIENVRLFNETNEALERQTATAEVLKVISGSPTDVAPVFDAILRSAVNLCGAEIAAVFPFDGKLVHLGATYNWSQEAKDYFAKVYPSPPSDKLMSGRTILSRAIVTLPDAATDPHYDPTSAITGHWRRMLGVPMLREDEPVGAMVVCWREPGETPHRQVDLLQTFADQAVIAIENARLFNETKEALERQTATAEILKVISSSPTDVQPVMDSLARRAGLMTNSLFAAVVLVDGDALHAKATYVSASLPSGKREGQMANAALPLRPTLVTGRAILERRTVHIDDIVPLLDSEYPDARDSQRDSGFRAVLAVPMIRDGQAIGALCVYHGAPRKFSDQEVTLLETFASQAVIAIENVRLFNETKESLERQTATAEILRVISSSPTDIQPVLDAVAVRAARLCDATDAIIRLVEGDNSRVVAHFGPDPATLGVYKIRRGGLGSEVILTCQTIHVHDILSPESRAKYPETPGLKYGTGHRTVLAVPLVREGTAMGVILIRRREVRPFSDTQIKLLEMFADQAVIAIENVRLFREIQEKSAQLEIANKHKSDFLANMSHELRTPLNAIIGFSEVLIDQMFGEVNEKQADYLKDIHESGRHLLSLINDILDLAKIEAGRMELEVSRFHLPTAISNAMTLIRERAQRHGIQLGSEVDARLGEFEADERKVKQILLNLLSNAVKFTPDGGRIDVSAKLDTTNVEIAVRDTGIGIAPEDQSALFEEFKQVGTDYTRKAEGTGLGLALTKKFVELHGGGIRVDSTPGKGSTFSFTLPVRQE